MSVSVSQVPAQPPTEALIGTATKPIFPIFIAKFEKEGKVVGSATVNIPVHKDIYEYVQRNWGSDEVIFYMDGFTGKMESWSVGMNKSFNFLNSIGAMSDSRTWVKTARLHLMNFLRKLKPMEQ